MKFKTFESLNSSIYLSNSSTIITYPIDYYNNYNIHYIIIIIYNIHRDPLFVTRQPAPPPVASTIWPGVGMGGGPLQHADIEYHYTAPPPHTFTSPPTTPMTPGPLTPHHGPNRFPMGQLDHIPGSLVIYQKLVFIIMYICLCVSLCLSVSVCVLVCVCVCVCVCMSQCVCVCVCVCVCICVSACVFVVIYVYVSVYTTLSSE